MSDHAAGGDALSDDEYGLDDQVAEEPLVEPDMRPPGEPNEDIESELEGDFACVYPLRGGSAVLMPCLVATMKRGRRDKIDRMNHGTLTSMKSSETT